MGNISIKLEEGSIKKALKIMMSESNIKSMASLGEMLGYKKTTFRSAVNNNTIRTKDFIKAVELMGFEIMINKSEKKEGQSV